MSKPIPEVRKDLIMQASHLEQTAIRLRHSIDEIEKQAELLDTLAEYLRYLAEETKRASPNGRAPIASAPMTTKLAGKIKVYARAYPDASHQEIAALFDVNPGRVSEALAGKYNFPRVKEGV